MSNVTGPETYRPHQEFTRSANESAWCRSFGRCRAGAGQHGHEPEAPPAADDPGLAPG